MRRSGCGDRGRASPPIVAVSASQHKQRLDAERRLSLPKGSVSIRGATGIRSKGATRACSPTLDNGWGHQRHLPPDRRQCRAWTTKPPPTSFATTLIRGGTDLVIVAELLGHSRLDTVRVYTRPTAQDQAKALELLPTDRWPNT